MTNNILLSNRVYGSDFLLMNDKELLALHHVCIGVVNTVLVIQIVLQIRDLFVGLTMY